ncbi:MAG: HAD-IA family hydrolase [Lachnospiraceae bacterium]|nr:HAD-IA family hydrolase [Lachnospiraceae bacterium]
MYDLLKDKKVIFFDVGYTLDYPASGDWMFTKKFYEIVGDKLSGYSPEEIQRAKELSMQFLEQNHLVKGTEEEYQQFIRFYSDISRYLNLSLTTEEVKAIAYDRTNNMDNYIVYPDAKVVLEELSKTHMLGIISDTWPSIEQQLCAIGVRDYFTISTYSCELGKFKPDELLYRDALRKSGCKAEETVFIDDATRNLEGAAKLGITPILIAANPASDVDSPYLKIHSLSELLK